MTAEVVVLSGKGGTGKTSVCAALGATATDVVHVDADVDAANLHLILAAHPVETHAFSTGASYRIDRATCRACGICVDACAFDAIVPAGKVFAVDVLGCEGCGLCSRLCPYDAVRSSPARTGTWMVSRTAFGPLVHAELAPGADNSGKLVAEVRARGREMAIERGSRLLLVDGPPGIGCPAISACTGADLVLLVLEPGRACLRDAERILTLLDRLHLPRRAVINKCDIEPEVAAEVEALCRDRGAPVIGRLPYDPAVAAWQETADVLLAVGGTTLAGAVDDLRRAFASAVATSVTTGSIP